MTNMDKDIKAVYKRFEDLSWLNDRERKEKQKAFLKQEIEEAVIRERERIKEWLKSNSGLDSDGDLAVKLDDLLDNLSRLPKKG